MSKNTNALFVPYYANQVVITVLKFLKSVVKLMVSLQNKKVTKKVQQ